MGAYRLVKTRGFLLIPVFSLLLASSASGHVILDDPNGGEELEVGSVFTIKWRIQISHNLQNWDLWYSTTGSGGPWTPLATNLPPGF